MSPSRRDAPTPSGPPAPGTDQDGTTAVGGPGWVRRLWGCMLVHRRDVVLSLGAAVLGSACQTVVPLVERQIVDGVIVERTSALWPWLVLLVTLAVATFAFSYVRRYRAGKVALGVQYDLRNAMHDHLQSLDFDNLDRMPTGQLVARANSDSTLVQGLLNFLPIMSSNILLVVFSLGVMLVLSPLLAVVSLVVAPLLVWVSYRMRRRVFPATWDGQQREGDVIGIVDEDVNGVRVVKAFGQEDHELTRVADAAQTLYGSQMRAVRLSARFQPLLQAVPAFGQVAILALGGWMALRHEISIGTFLAFSTYMTQLVGPAQRLANVLTIGQQARAGMERIFQLLDLRPAIADPGDAVELPVLDGSIDFDGVDFAYGGGPAVLHGLTLHVDAGERVAIVGPSGSGKSTLTSLVSRFYDPSAGQVRVDGHDLRQVALSSLRRQVGTVFEESFLFSVSVHDNIAYGRPGASDDDVAAAARVAGADGFIAALPRGYETVVGERGLTLSGGQRQRIALARAVLSDPRILILDDATSAVDSTVEAAIHDGLRTVMAGRTTLLVAHRRSTLHLADRIIVLDAGRIVGQGTHDELWATIPLYRSLLTGMESDDDDGRGRCAGGGEAGTGGTGGGGAGDRGAGCSGRSRQAPTARQTQPPVTAGVDRRRPVTASAWLGDRHDDRGGRTAARTVGAPSMGPGLGGGGGGWRLNLAPTPELLARVADLPPVRDRATVDLDAESRVDRDFDLRRLLGQFRRPLGIGLILVVLDALASLAGPVLVKTGVDRGVQAGSTGVLFAASAVYLVVTLVDMVDEVGETFVTGRAAQRIMLSLRIRIWAQLQRLSLDYYESEMAGRIMTRMTTDVDQFESLIENGVLSALVSLVTFVGVGVALVALDVRLGLFTLIVVIPLAAATVVFRRRAAALYDGARERIAIVNADFQESLSGVRESQAFVHEDATRAHFHRLGADYLDSRVAAQRLVAIYFPFVQLLSGVADTIVLGVGSGMIASGHLTSGALIAFILYIDLFFSPIQQLSQVFDAWQQTRVSVSRISDLMALETRTPAATDVVDPGPLRGDIRFERVRFSYPMATPQSGRRAGAAGPVRPGPADPRLLETDDALVVRPPEAIRGVDLHLAAGETVALVGETGAGKSTVMKLLARFYDPDAGSVRVDGHDLRTIDLRSYRRQLGYVPQEAFLFTGTVRDNIAYGRPDAGDAEVEAAARAVGAHDLIAALPGGYLHRLSERGRSLSAGQRQLIALARAELVDPAILLLDEATSNLDLATEARVAAAMQHLASGRTTLVIAHRLQTAMAADRIVVLDRGGVAETGTHDELVAAGGRYAGMWKAFDVGEDRHRSEQAPVF